MIMTTSIIYSDVEITVFLIILPEKIIYNIASNIIKTGSRKKTASIAFDLLSNSNTIKRNKNKNIIE